MPASCPLVIPLGRDDQLNPLNTIALQTIVFIGSFHEKKIQMFITDEAAKIPTLSALFGCPELSYWSHVEHHLHLPWFHCSYIGEDEDGEKFTHMIFLSRPEQLQQMALTEGLEITELQIVLPGHMSKQGQWVMRPLAEIWAGEVPGEGCTELVYVTSAGERFCFNEEISDENQLADKRLLYPTSP